MRGQVLLKELLRREDVDVVALCDIEPIMLGRALAMVVNLVDPEVFVLGGGMSNVT